jgi:DedD protein
MAFFKFRFPGQTASAEALTSGSNENIDVVRRRARHRLMGAVVLVLTAVVGFPLLLDSQPRPVAVDTPILIPDRKYTPPLSHASTEPASQAPAKPLLPTDQLATIEPSANTRKEAASKPTSPAGASPKYDKPGMTAPSQEPGGKAQSLLEGKSSPPVGAERVVIQLGAFSDPIKVREVRHKLEQAGVKSYIQVVEKDGKSTTRIRVGPYDTREEADKAAVRIRKLDLPVSFLKI